jgi:hypothetical protein
MGGGNSTASQHAIFMFFLFLLFRGGEKAKLLYIEIGRGINE